MAKDDIFNRPEWEVSPFEFNERVVRVFDDMIGRSVPLYREMLRRQAQLAARFYQNGTRIYDLGCSNGNLGLLLRETMGKRDFEMVAVDNSEPMLEVYRQRLDDLSGGGRIELRREDIRGVAMENASVVVVNLTLQFLPLADRSRIIESIHEALVPGGILLLTEKVIHEEPGLKDLQQEFYYLFKEENGYSRLEISRKREALDNVLIPETLDDHLERLEEAGFPAVDVWLKWFNFASLICKKEGP